MRASTELSTAAAFGETATEYDVRKIFKTVARDVRGFENVIFTDADGQTLAAARSGAEGPTKSHDIVINEQGYVDIHVPQGTNMGFTVNGTTAYTVYDLITEGTVTESIGLEKGFYRVAVNDVVSYVAGSLTVNYQSNYYDYSLNMYDEVGRLKSSFQPLVDADGNKLETKYRYNTLGQLVYTQSPDEGDAWFLYREDGQIRFSINSLQWKNGKFSYTNYDSKARPVESGVYTDVSGYLGAYVTSENVTDLTDPFNQSLKDLIDVLDGMTDANCSEVQNTVYDAYADTNEDGIPDDMVSSIPASIVNTYKPTFLSGNVYKTTNDNAATWYGYDIYGRVKWLVQDIAVLGAKTIDYEYNPITGLVEYVHYQKGQTDEFIHWYTYDEANQLSMVRTAVDMQGPWETHAKYFYYETGELKRKELAFDDQDNPSQGLDYVYSLDGKLKSLNHPSLSPENDICKDEFGNPCDSNDLFGMQLDYHVGDYMRTSNMNIGQTQYGTDKLNGNIKSIRWKNAGPLSGAEASEYVYEYDRNNWLKSANFDPGNTDTSSGLLANDESTTIYTNGQNDILEATQSYTLKPGFHAQEGSTITVRIDPNGGGSSSGDYDVTNIMYDVNGNIQSLVRNAQGPMDNLAYSYKTDKPNQLLRVEDTVDDNVLTNDDIDNQTGNNYEYNEIGQLVYDNSEQIAYFYNASGLVTEVKKGSFTAVKFHYNDRNYRIRKESFNPNNGNLIQNTYYVRDVSGQVMAIYSDYGGSMDLKEQPIYGAGRVGVAYNGTGNAKQYVYEMTDHLGNVRALFTKNGTNANLEGVTDYYPGGMAMPERNIVGDYRYDYQGQEKDDETGKIAFQLRLYDQRIMRWLSPDPYGQHASPYMSMGNSWANNVDPDGGMDCPDPPCNNTSDVSAAILLDEVVVTAPNKFSDRVDIFGIVGAEHLRDPSQYAIWETTFQGNLDDYNRQFNTNYASEREAFADWNYTFNYAVPQREHILDIHEATAEAAEYLSYILPAGEIAVGGKLIYLGVTRVSKVSIHGYRAFKVGHASSKGLKSSAYFTRHLRELGLNTKFFGPTLYGQSKTLGTFLGRNSPILGAGLVGDGTRRLYNLIND